MTQLRRVSWHASLTTCDATDDDIGFKNAMRLARAAADHVERIHPGNGSDRCRCILTPSAYNGAHCNLLTSINNFRAFS